MTDFTIIPNEQTPKVPYMEETEMKDWIKENDDLFDQFLEFASSQPTAVGLAANQCAYKGERFMARMFAIRWPKETPTRLIIDPRITSSNGDYETKVEGCLTWKGRAIKAKRFYRVSVLYWDRYGESHLETFTGFDAQIWQHEINHLDGIEEDVIDAPRSWIADKTQRNAPCPCSSGKKFKKCCGKK